MPVHRREVAELKSIFDRCLQRVAGALAAEPHLLDGKEGQRMMSDAIKDHLDATLGWWWRNVPSGNRSITPEQAAELERLVGGNPPVGG